MNIEWKVINGFIAYEVSNKGEIRNRDTGRVLKQKTDRGGYKQVGLYQDGKPHWKLVHRLVAKAFILNIDNKPTVNHKDLDRANNDLSNLEWMTQKENMLHAVDNGSFDNMGKWLSKKIKIIELDMVFESKNECAEYINKRFFRSKKKLLTIASSISKAITSPKHKTAYGFTYKYL